MGQRGPLLSWTSVDGAALPVCSGCVCTTLGQPQVLDNHGERASDAHYMFPSPASLPISVSDQSVHIHSGWSARAWLIFIQRGS